MVDDRLAVSVTHADGRVTRWGPGEADTARIINDLSFSTSSPGGFRELSCSVLRDIYPQADEALLDTVTVYGPGGQVVWEGRWQQLPRETGAANRMSPQAVGWSSHLTDQKSFREIYVDRDLGRWQTIPLNERLRLATAGTDFASLAYGQQDGSLAVALPNQALGAQVVAQAWYTAPPGVLIKYVPYRGVTAGVPGGYVATIRGTAGDSYVAETTYTPTLDDAVRLITLGTARRYVNVELYSNGTAATPAAGAHHTYKRLAVYGDHGLAAHTTTAGEPDGFYASDIIADVVGRAAPLLNVTSSSIQATTFAVPQAAYLDPCTAADVVADVNKYHGWDWLVYDNRTFYYQPAGSGVEWRARRADGAQLRLDGVSSDVILNAMYVSYTDGTGRQKLAGPPGSGADVTDASLEDTSDNHPVNSHGIPEKSDVLRISHPTTDAGAVVIGALALYERNVATRRGQITLTGRVEHPTEGKVPVWRVRAGDTIIVTDYMGDVPRRIIQTDYSHSTRTLTATLDNTPPVLDAILERVAVAVGGIA